MRVRLGQSERLYKSGEFRVSFPNLAPQDGAVANSVDRIDGQVEDDIRRVSGLEQHQNRSWIDRIRQVSDELRAGLRCVGYGRPILIDVLMVECNTQLLPKATEITYRREDAATHPRLFLVSIAAGDLGDVDKERWICISQFDNIQQCLFFPRLCDGLIVGQAILNNGRLRDMPAADLYQCEREQKN